MLRIYIIGICILFVAIIANIIAEKLGLSTWYDFSFQLSKRGWTVIKEVGLLSGLWLFILYPFILGLAYIVGDKIYTFF